MHIYIYRHLNDVCYFYICYLVYSGVTILPCVVYTYTYNYIHNDISQMYIYIYIIIYICENVSAGSASPMSVAQQWWSGGLEHGLRGSWAQQLGEIR